MQKTSASQNQPKPEAVRQKHHVTPAPKSASVYDFTQYAGERKRAEQEVQAAHQAKVDVLKAQAAVALETKAMAIEAAKLREGVEDQTAALKDIAKQQTKSASRKKQSTQKRSSKSPSKPRSAFDQDLLVRMQHEISSRQVKGSIRSLQAAYNLGFTKAQMYHARLQQLGVVPESSQNLAVTQG